MPTFSEVLLSGSTNGLAIDVVKTVTPGDVIHTASATAIDEIWIYAVNRSANKVTLTLEWGGVAAKDLIVVDLPKESVGKILIDPGCPLTGSVVVGALASVASVVSIFGWVNRVTP